MEWFRRPRFPEGERGLRLLGSGEAAGGGAGSLVRQGKPIDAMPVFGARKSRNHSISVVHNAGDDRAAVGPVAAWTERHRSQKRRSRKLRRRAGVRTRASTSSRKKGRAASVGRGPSPGFGTRVRDDGRRAPCGISPCERAPCDRASRAASDMPASQMCRRIMRAAASGSTAPRPRRPGDRDRRAWRGSRSPPPHRRSGGRSGWTAR